MNFKNFIRLVAVVFATLTLFACAGNKSQASKNNMIPDNALMAFKVDATQLWNKAIGEPGSQVAMLWDMAKSGIAMQASSMGEDGALLRNVMEDPSVLGLRLDIPFVVSIAPDVEDLLDDEMSGDVYIVALLHDRKAFLSYADALLDSADEADFAGAYKEELNAKYTYYFLSSDEEMSVDMGVSSGSVVLRCHFAESYAPIAMKESMLALFDNGGPAKTEGLKNFYASKGVTAIWVDTDAIMTELMLVDEFEDELTTTAAQTYKPLYKGSSFVSELFLNDGATVAKFSVYGSDELKKYAVKYNALASDKFFNQMPYSSAFVFNLALANLSGLANELSNMNEEYAEAIAMLEEEYDFNVELLEGFPGVISFALDGKDLTEGIPGFAFFMECKENVWDYVQDLLVEGFVYVGDKTYSIGDMGYITYKDGAIAITDTQTAEQSEKTFADAPLAKQIAKGGMLIDLTALSSEVLDMLAEEIDEYMTGDDLLQFANSVVLTTSDDHMSATLTVNMGDKEHNILEKLILESINNAF